jgi:hypothetical protein
MANTRKRPLKRRSRKERKGQRSRNERSRKGSKGATPRIVDPEFATTTHRGTKASSCAIDYHYQSYETFSSYLMMYLKANPKIASYVFVPDDMSEMMVELDISSGSVKPIYISEKVLRSYLKKALAQSKVQLIPLTLNLKVPDNPNHANVLMINKHTHTIELFEPHGARTSASTLGGQVGAYNKKLRFLKTYWADILPDYTVINTVDEIKRTAFQTDKDPVGHSGYCVTWSLLYAQYRILNPTVPYPTLIRHIDGKITTRLLLRFARAVEVTLKST